MTAKLTLPDDFLVSTGLTESDCLIELAVHLYAQRRISVEHALQMTELSRVEFDDALATHRP
jgi:predicted HTH domain antitoxin